MGAWILAKADIDGTERFAVVAVSALPHMAQWTAVDPDDVREQPWDFEQPAPEASALPGMAAPDGTDQAAGTAGTTEPDTGSIDAGKTANPTRRTTTGDKSADSIKE